MCANKAFVVLVDVHESLLQHVFFHIDYRGSEELVVRNLSVFVNIHAVEGLFNFFMVLGDA